MRISDWSSDVCASDLVRIWAGGKYAHRNLDAREISDFFRWRIMGLFSIAAPPAVDVSKGGGVAAIRYCRIVIPPLPSRSAEHTSDLQSLMRISYAVFCLNKKKQHRYISSRTSIRMMATNKV